jgi:hypothetical protein
MLDFLFRSYMVIDHKALAGGKGTGEASKKTGDHVVQQGRPNLSAFAEDHGLARG